MYINIKKLHRKVIQLMTIKDEINRQIKHVENKIKNMKDYCLYRTKETINSNYWCGKQTINTTMDFLETFYSLGIINQEEYREYWHKISELNDLLFKTYTALT